MTILPLTIIWSTRPTQRPHCSSSDIDIVFSLRWCCIQQNLLNGAHRLLLLFRFNHAEACQDILRMLLLHQDNKIIYIDPILHNATIHPRTFRFGTRPCNRVSYAARPHQPLLTRVPFTVSNQAHTSSEPPFSDLGHLQISASMHLSSPQTL